MAEETVILIKDCQGTKLPGKLSSAVIGKILSSFRNLSSCNVLCGELLVPITNTTHSNQHDAHLLPNFFVKRDPSIVLYCKADDFSPLDHIETSLLEGIESQSIRYSVFIERTKLEWGSRLVVNDMVCAALPEATPVLQVATVVIRYIRQVKGLPGCQFGIEIMDDIFRGRGTTDGTFNGLRYFLCADKCGFFVPLDKISRDLVLKGDQSQTSPTTAADNISHVSTKVEGRQSNSPSNGTRSEAEIEFSTSPPSRLYPFNMNESVFVYDKKGNKVVGTIGWLGKRTKTRQFGCIVVGIVMESEVLSTDFEESIPGLTHLISAPKCHTLFIPATLVTSLEEKVLSKKKKKAVDVELNSVVHTGKLKQCEVVHPTGTVQNSVCSTSTLPHTSPRQPTQVTKDVLLEMERIKQENASLLEQLRREKHEKEQAQQELLTCKSELLSQKQKLSLCEKELGARNVDVWKVSQNKTETGDEIGIGGWGTVFKGKIHVAMKRLHPAILNPPNITRINREMKLLAEVHHPNLVQFIGTVFDERAERDQKPPLIITELLDMNLRQAYEQKELRPENRLSIFVDVARALDYLHQRYEPIIHRDVSAPNVLLQRLPNNQWKGKLSDLGSANFLQNAQTKGEGAFIYSPPEVMPRAYNPSRKRIPQTVKIDVYSYGVLLCEVTTSKLPTGENYGDMIDQVHAEHPPMYELIIHCTKEDPMNRPTMAEVLARLEKMPQVEAFSYV